MFCSYCKKIVHVYWVDHKRDSGPKNNLSDEYYCRECLHLISSPGSGRASEKEDIKEDKEGKEIWEKINRTNWGQLK